VRGGATRGAGRRGSPGSGNRRAGGGGGRRLSRSGRSAGGAPQGGHGRGPGELEVECGLPRPRLAGLAGDGLDQQHPGRDALGGQVPAAEGAAEGLEQPEGVPGLGKRDCVEFKAVFVGTTPSITATAHATTSDGVNLTLSATKTTQFGTMCSSPPPSVTVRERRVDLTDALARLRETVEKKLEGTPRQLWIIDEAGLLSNRDARMLLLRAEASCPRHGLQ